jgi:hypothetical protein
MAGIHYFSTMRPNRNKISLFLFLKLSQIGKYKKNFQGTFFYNNNKKIQYIITYIYDNVLLIVPTDPSACQIMRQFETHERTFWQTIS